MWSYSRIALGKVIHCAFNDVNVDSFVEQGIRRATDESETAENDRIAAQEVGASYISSVALTGIFVLNKYYAVVRGKF